VIKVNSVAGNQFCFCDFATFGLVQHLGPNHGFKLWVEWHELYFIRVLTWFLLFIPPQNSGFVLSGLLGVLVVIVM